MKWAKTDFIRKVCAYFESLEFDLNGKNLCVGLSGGADSVSLLRALIMVADKFGFDVSACHFNHMIRGEEADRDELFCKALCHKLGIKIYCGRDDVPAYSRVNKLSLEEAARECRYAFFERVSSKENVDYCVTAHNMNDNAETLIFNLIRGTGSNGATSIAPILKNILRPFLNISRKEIEEFLNELNQGYVTDSTNLSYEYTRNRIRNIIIPELERINPSAIKSLSRFIESCRNDRDYFEGVVSQNLYVDMRPLHKAVRDRIILRKYKDFSGNILNKSMLTEIEKALFSDSRTVLSLTDLHEAVIDEGKVDFYNKNDVNSYSLKEYILNIGNNSIFEEQTEVVLSVDNFISSENFNRIYTTDLLSFDNIIGVPKARSRRVGDKICIRGINKSLKKLFIDMKIPKEYRDIIPIISDDAGIIYVPFVGIADRVFPKDKNNNVFITTVFNSIDKERWNSAYEK